MWPFWPLRNRMRLGDAARALVVRAAQGPLSFLAGLLASRLRLANVFVIRCFDSHGRLRWIDFAFNSITSAGLDHTLNTELRGQSQISTWYMSLVDNAGFTAFASGDTMASHAGWAENQDWAASTRPAWSAGAPSGNAIVNGTTVDFAMSATKTIKGLFITSANDKGGSTGTLWSEAAFTGGNQAVNSGDTLKCTYTVSASSP